MNVRVKFLGGAGTVTGSKYLLEIDGAKILIDCGLFQGEKELRLRNWDEFPLDPAEIDAVVLTHAHIDHSGYLPKLVKKGYNKSIYCTHPTAALTEILLMDSAKLQEEEANYAAKKGYSKHAAPQPLYNTDDAQNVLPKLESIEFNQPINILDRVKINFLNAGHILGASILEVYLEGSTQTKKLTFSGDLGRMEDPILYPPHLCTETDILFIESTYGDRSNPSDHIKEALKEVVLKTVERSGCLLIPAFAVGRTQLITNLIKSLQEKNEIPMLPIYIDSPMAINTTNLYRKFEAFHQLKDTDNDPSNHSAFDAQNIHYYKAQSSSLVLNTIRKGAIIISASGMCTGGRILHHMYHRLKRKNDSILFVGYQPPGTRGRKILDGEPTVKIFGEVVKVECHVESIDGLSAHADKDELHKWLLNFKSKPKNTFIIHGEKKSSEALKYFIDRDLKWNSVIPEYLKGYTLFENI